jgi:AraC-like DNA-binding protein
MFSCGRLGAVSDFALMLLPATSGVAAWPAVMIVWGPGFTTTAHRHHCVQLIMSMRGSLLIRSGPEAKWRKCGAVLVRPDAVHEIDARGGTVLLAFVDAESETGVALSERVHGDFAPVPPRQLVRWRDALGPTLNEARVDRWLTKYLLRRRRAVAIHPGIQRVLTHLREPRAMLGDLSLPKLAGIAGLSRSRFMHAFTESVGIPVRPYILWLRVQLAACELIDGASITAAAYRAGFSDAAHLTRTFRRMFGTTPSDLGLRNRLSRGFSPVRVRQTTKVTSKLRVGN